MPDDPQLAVDRQAGDDDDESVGHELLFIYEGVYRRRPGRVYVGVSGSTGIRCPSTTGDRFTKGEQMRKRRLFSTLLVGLVAFGGVTVAEITTADDAQAACSGVSHPRVRYWCNTVQPLNAYYYPSGSPKHYNSMYEGGSLPVGIYWQIPGGAKWGAVNATGFAYKTYQSTTDYPVCWNRSSSTISSARCDTVLS